MTGNRPVRNITLDPVDDRAAYDLAVPVVEAAIDALGPLDGAFHMELFVHEAGVTFGECGGQAGGGMIQEEVEGQTRCRPGRRPRSKVSVGREPSLRGCPEPSRSVGSTNLTCLDGNPLGRADREGDRSAGKESRWRGSRCPSVSSIGGRCRPPRSVKVGAACASAPDVEQLETRLDDLVAWFQERVRVSPPGATRAEPASYSKQQLVGEGRGRRR